MMIPKFLEETIKNFSYTDLLEWTKDSFKFFYNPSNLLKKFENSNQKFEQILFYTLLLTILYTFNIKEFEITNLKSYRFFLGILVYSLPFSIINYLAIRSLHKVSFWSIFCKVLLLALITSIFSSIFISLFINNENYNFLLINTITNVLFYLYTLILIPILLNENLKNKLISILLSILFFNILTTITILMYKNDNNSTILSFDPIYNEHLKSVEGIKTLKGEPYSLTKILDKDKKAEFYSTFSTIEKDTIYRNSDKMLDYHKRLFKENSEKLSKLSDSLYFNRNKIAIKYLSSYYDNLSTMFNYDFDDKDLISNQAHLDKDSSVVFYEKEYLINKNITKPYRNFMEESKKIYEGYEYANKPTVIISVLNIPTSLVFKIFNIELNSDIMIGI